MSTAIEKEKPIWVNVEEAMKLLGVRRNLMYRLINSGRIKSTKAGGRRLISRKSIEDLADPAPRRRSHTQVSSAGNTRPDAPGASISAIDWGGLEWQITKS